MTRSRYGDIDKSIEYAIADHSPEREIMPKPKQKAFTYNKPSLKTKKDPTTDHAKKLSNH
jgi:hypothetical protein